MARVAVVTGGTRGIGEAISTGLAKAGFKVAATYHGNDDRAREFSGRTGIQAFKFDVCDFAACQEGVKAIETALGPIEVLVNNAGITRDSTLQRMDFEQWNAVIQTNLSSCFNIRPCFWSSASLASTAFKSFSICGTRPYCSSDAF